MRGERDWAWLDPATARGRLAHQAVFGVALILLWTAGGAIWPRAVPYPWLVVDALTTQLADGSLQSALVAALGAILAGYVAAVVVGVTAGLAMGLDGRVEAIFDPYLDALYAMPFAAVIPAMVMWFGTGFRIRVVVVFLFAVFPVTINTLEGVRSVPPRLLALAQSFDAGSLYTIRHVVLPAELPYIFAGLRLGGGLAVRGLVVCELLVAVTGFGRLITQWSAAFRLEGVVSVVLVLMLLGVGFTWLLTRVEDAVVTWDPAAVEEG